MRLLRPSSEITILLNILVWPAIHFLVGFIAARMSLSSFRIEKGIYRILGWERSGRFYERFFRIKKWKDRLPDCGDFFGPGFKKRRLESRDAAYLETFSRETCRAEWAHWMTMAGAPVFLLWNEWWVEPIMIGYALAANLPCILVQRFNRARLERILRPRKRPGG